MWAFKKVSRDRNNFTVLTAKTLPPMMQVMRDIGGIELPEALVRVAGEAKSDGGPPSSTNGTAADGGPTAPK